MTPSGGCEQAAASARACWDTWRAAHASSATSPFALTSTILRHTMHCMARQGRGEDGLARFGEPGVLVLLSLSGGPKHGYAITADVFEQTGVRLGPGTLYGSLTKLVERGLIEPIPSDDRRRPYRITGAGQTALASQLANWSRIVSAGELRLGGLG